MDLRIGRPNSTTSQKSEPTAKPTTQSSDTVKDSLTRDGTYKRIFSEQRNDKKGGVFEIYIRQTVCSHNIKAQDAVKQTLEPEESIFFIDAKCQEMEKPILTRNAPHTANFTSQIYLIREGNTLRFANKFECEYLSKYCKTTLNQDTGCMIMQNPCVREMMAAHKSPVPPRDNTVYDKIFCDVGSLFEIYQIKTSENQQENFYQLVKEAIKAHKFLFMIEGEILIDNAPNKNMFANKQYLIRYGCILRFATSKEIKKLEEIAKYQKLCKRMLSKHGSLVNELVITHTPSIDKAKEGITKVYKELIENTIEEIQQMSCEIGNVAKHLQPKNIFDIYQHRPYELIFEHEPTKGSVFQIYYRDTDKVDSASYRQIYNNIVNLMKNKPNLFFITIGTDGTKYLSKTPPQQSEFNGKIYLIREQLGVQDTFRFANLKEEHILNTQIEELRSKQIKEIGMHIMHNSYGRMVMANFRATGPQRFNSLKNLAEKIFKFERIVAPINILFQVKQKLYNQSYTQYHKLTLKRFGLPLKKIFEVMQIYGSLYEDNKKKIKNSNNGLSPILVAIKIGGMDIEFMLNQYLTDTDKYRINVSMELKEESKIKGYISSSYKDIIEKIASTFKKHSSQQREIANDIMNCLNSNMNSKVNKLGDELKFWPSLDNDTRNQLVELIVLTQVVDSNIISGVQGMNKLARNIFREIANGVNTFTNGFSPNKAGKINSTLGYPPANFYNSAKAIEAVRTVTRYGAQCYDMSEDSEEVYK